MMIETPDIAGASRALMAAYSDRKAWLEREKAAATAHGVIAELERVEAALNESGHAILSLHEVFNAVLQRRLEAGRKALKEYGDHSDALLKDVPDNPSPELARMYLANIALLKMRGQQMELGDQIDLIDDMGFFAAFASGTIVLSDHDNAGLRAALNSLAEALTDNLATSALGPFAWIKAVVDAILAAQKAEEERRTAMNDHMARYQALHDAALRWSAAAEAFARARSAV